MNIDEVTSIVTGGASGLGEATVRDIVSHGGRAFILDLEEEKARKLADELGSNAAFFMLMLQMKTVFKTQWERHVTLLGTSMCL